MKVSNEHETIVKFLKAYEDYGEALEKYSFDYEPGILSLEIMSRHERLDDAKIKFVDSAVLFASYIANEQKRSRRSLRGFVSEVHKHTKSAGASLLARIGLRGSK